MSASYFSGMASELCRFPDANRASDLKIVYTAMHGVGSPWFHKVGCPEGRDQPSRDRAVG